MQLITTVVMTFVVVMLLIIITDNSESKAEKFREYVEIGLISTDSLSEKVELLEQMRAEFLYRTNYYQEHHAAAYSQSIGELHATKTIAELESFQMPEILTTDMHGEAVPYTDIYLKHKIQILEVYANEN